MKIFKVIVITLILGGLLVPSLGCGSESSESTESQIVTVQRGDLVLDVTAVGNLALSYTAEPAFKIAGYVEEVLVEEGDTVEEGQVLASLDTTSLEQTVKTAERAVKTAEIDLESATDSYRKITYPYDYVTFTFDVPAAVALTGDVQRELDEALEIMQELGLSREQYDWEQYWEVWHSLKQAQDDLVEVRENLIRGYGPDVFDSGILPMTDFWTLRAAQLQMDKAQVALDKANDTLDIARDELGKAVVVAPFDGFITKVNVEGGDEVYKGTVVAQLADPDRFEAEVMVSEMDVFQVKLGGDATVQIDAMPTLTLPAKVTHIAPTATIEAGVVNYKVKVEIESLEAVMQEQQQVMQDISSGELPERIQQAIEEGSITQEQAEEMMKQRPGGTLLENIELREGLTVIVSVIIQERHDVLLVPNQAIIGQELATFVQVLEDDVIQKRPVITGLSDWQYTEIIEGLSEGEKVVVPKVTTTTPTTSEKESSPFRMLPGKGGK